jgi:anaerobic selenocysteine-containing dehydrogenase
VGSKRGVDLREAAEHAELLVIWGGNPVTTQVNVMQHAIAAKKRGAKLVVVDPYRTGTAEKADLHLPVRAGTDGAMACAMMHVLLRELDQSRPDSDSCKSPRDLGARSRNGY